jgi:hypothetical protein
MVACRWGRVGFFAELHADLRRMAYRLGQKIARDSMSPATLDDLLQAADATLAPVLERYRQGAEDGWSDRSPATLEAAERSKRQQEWEERNAPLPSIVRR